MRHLSKSLLTVSVLSGLVLPNLSFATNGLFLPGIGAKSIGMGGVSIALKLDALAPATNGAGIVGMGDRLDVGAALFHVPRRAFVDSNNDSVFGDSIAEDKSDKNYFLIPNIGYTQQLTDDITLGITAFGAGLGTSYEGIYDFNGSGNKIVIDLKQMQLPFTLAYRVNDNHAVSASLTAAIQVFQAKGFESFNVVSSEPDKLTDHGLKVSYGGGARLGYMFTSDDDEFSFGAYYASRVYMTKFDDYSGLFAEQGDLDIPQNYGIGFAYKFIPKLTTALDVVYIDWDSVASISNRGPELYTGDPLTGPNNAVGGDGRGALGRDDGMGFGWISQTVYKLGFAYQYSPETTLTWGANYAKSPVPDDQLAYAVIGPGIIEKHLALGFTQKLNGYTILGGKNAEITVSYLHAFKEKLAGVSAVGTSLDESGNTQLFAGYAEAEIVQNQLEISYGLSF